MHNWVHKAELQPKSGQSPDHVAVDETVIRLNDEQYWLYTAIDPETNELLYTRLEPTTNNVLAHAFFADLREKHDVDDVPRNQRFLVCKQDSQRLVNAAFLIDGSHSLKDACRRHSLDFRYEKHGNRNSVERVFRELSVSQTASATPTQRLPTIGFDLSPSHGISLSKHYRKI